MFSTHSPFDLVSSTSLDEPFGDEVPHNPTTTPTPHTTSQQSTHHQHKRQLRSQDARKSRQTRRIQRRAQARRVYRGWLSHFPDPQPYGGKGSARRLHNSKPSYGPTLPHRETGSQGIHAAILLRSSQSGNATNSEEECKFSSR